MTSYQRVPYDINITKSLPDNYDEKDVKEQLRLNSDADGDKKCDFINPFTNTCMITEIGDNHRGYLGYKDNGTKLVTNDGAIDTVVDRWINRTSTNISPSLE